MLPKYLKKENEGSKHSSAPDLKETVVYHGREARQLTPYMSALPQAEPPSLQEAEIKSWILHRILKVGSQSDTNS